MADSWMDQSESATFGEVDGNNVFAIIKHVTAQSRIGLASCLDVGCGRNPAIDWFAKFADSEAPRYLGLDTDEQILRELRERGIPADNPFTTQRELASDLVLAKEVIEHVRPDESEAFFRFCAANTRKVFALTTPNFEYWPGGRAADRELRWIPDHFPGFRPESGDPHHHKQEMTPTNLLTYMQAAFPAEEWQVRVLRAWPWDLTDLARRTSWRVYFKLFGVAWKRSAS